MAKRKIIQMKEFPGVAKVELLEVPLSDTSRVYDVILNVEEGYSRVVFHMRYKTSAEKLIKLLDEDTVDIASTNR